ncbi:MAG: putative lipid II flippase FtsW [Oscillospiraceae bacterium]|jgi:cell division protein FtsW
MSSNWGSGYKSDLYYGDLPKAPIDAKKQGVSETARPGEADGWFIRGPLDLPFLMLTVIILCFGVVMVFSASYASAYYETGKPTHYFMRQSIFAVLGIVVMMLVSRINYRKYKQMAPLIMGVSIILLITVLFIGVRSGDARRWIDLGFTTFQPSELVKLAIILLFAKMICAYKHKMRTFRYGVLPFALLLVLVCFLLYLEPHLSAMVIVLCIGATMMFLGGTRKFWFVGGVLVVALAAWLIIGQLGYASSRIAAWRDPFSDTQGVGWQIIQSLYSIGSGGLTGLGLGNSRQKFLYLPEEHNDFIFSVLCEELGFIGAVIVILLFMLLIVRGYWIAAHARDKYGTLIAAGISTLLAFQVFFNIAVVTNFIPVTGISLPFFSYGGTALVMQLAEMGIVLSVARNAPITA